MKWAVSVFHTFLYVIWKRFFVNMQHHICKSATQLSFHRSNFALNLIKTTTMEEKFILSYEAPLVEVIEVEVEKGFNVSMEYEDWN